MDSLDLLSKPDKHEESIMEIFQGNVRYSGPELFDRPLYCLAFFNRSGSNLLADHLRQTPYFSGFHEELNFRGVEIRSRQWGALSFPDYIKAVMAPAEGKTYGFKASMGQLMMLERFGIPNMFKGGLRIIHIQREDLVGQAVSHLISSQSQQWTSEQQSTASKVEIRYDAERLTSIIDAAHRSASGIKTYAQVFDRPRLEVSYEDVVRHPSKVLRRIAKFSGQNGSDWEAREPKIRRQATSLNVSFRKRYIEEVREKLLSNKAPEKITFNVRMTDVELSKYQKIICKARKAIQRFQP